MPRVFPTLRGWLILGAACSWIAAGEVNHNAPCLILGAGLLALFITALPFAATALRGITVRRGAPGEAVVGQRVDLPLILRNHLSRRRPGMVVIERLPFAGPDNHAHVAGPPPPGGECVVERKVLALRRGEYSLDMVRLRSGDPAGLFVAERRFHLPRSLLILPAGEPLAGFRFQNERAVPAPTGHPFGQSGTSLEFYGVRAYSPADGLCRIHWKSSARLGVLMVREFERTGVPSIALLVDAEERYISGDDYWSNLEFLIRCAASLCRHAAGLYCRIAFAAGGAEEILIPSRFSNQNQWDILRTLAVLRPGPVPLDAPALQIGESLPRRTHVFCFSLSAAPRTRRILGLLEQHDMRVTWFCAPPQAFRTAGGRFRTKTQKRQNRIPAFPESREGGPAPLMVHPGVTVAHLFQMISSAHG